MVVVKMIPEATEAQIPDLLCFWQEERAAQLSLLADQTRMTKGRHALQGGARIKRR